MHRAGEEVVASDGSSMNADGLEGIRVINVHDAQVEILCGFGLAPYVVYVSSLANPCQHFQILYH